MYFYFMVIDAESDANVYDHHQILILSHKAEFSEFGKNNFILYQLYMFVVCVRCFCLVGN